ncbi:MAG: zinc ribbon domain-containing protein [Victivallales bacterium]|nr:zinc ribbon domain-containing protein [Victivallales bacterium]
MAITIKCSECGHENQLGDLFCRQCGNELDMDVLDPGEIKVVHKHKGAKLLKEFIFLVVVFGVLGTIICMMLAPIGVTFPTSDDTAYFSKISAGAATLLDRKDKSSQIVKQNIAGGVFARAIVKDDNLLAITTVNKDTKEITYTFRKSYYGFPVTLSLVGKLNSGNASNDFNYRLADNTVFTVDNTKIGMVPTSRALAPYIRKFFGDFMQRDEYKNLPNTFSDVTLTKDDDFNVTLLSNEEKEKKAEQ